MNVYVQGRKVRLTPTEFKAQGGEGAVYVRDGMAYKVYADSGKAISPGKIQELSVLSLPEIIRPQDVLWDDRHVPVGYTMSHVPDAFVLCRMFPRAFRERIGLTPEIAWHLVQRLRDGVAHVHAQGLLIVDLNEMNFLVDTQMEHVFFIDVDSYQTPSFAATALMESVRDRHAPGGFGPATDWFSFAVVSFQMFVGIHPYKGKHPTLKTLDERMRHNVSVFDPSVSVPSACLPWDVVPQAYRDWYRAVFANGLRVPPPQGAQAVIVIPPQAPPPMENGAFVLSRLLECVGSVVSVTRSVVVTTEAIYREGRRCADAMPGAQIALTPGGRAVRVTLERGRLHLFDLIDKTNIPADLAGEGVIVSEGRVYVKQGPGLWELEFLETASRTLPHLKRVGSVLENATQLFDGVALQSVVGAWHASLLAAPGLCPQVRLAELDGSQVLDAKFQGGVLMVIAAQEGRYQKFVFRFDATSTAYDVRVIPDVTALNVNFVVLKSGLCLHLNDQEELEVFPAHRGAAGMKMLADPVLGGDCRLMTDGLVALFARGNALFQFTMR